MPRPADMYLARHNTPVAIRSTGSVVGIHYGADVLNGCLYEVTIDFLRWNDGNKLLDFLARLQPKSAIFSGHRLARLTPYTIRQRCHGLPFRSSGTVSAKRIVLLLRLS